MEIKQKAKIDYPCRWIYKVIGTDKEQLQQLIKSLLQDCSYTVSLSHASATGKYHCLNLEVSVDSEDKRMAIYEALLAEGCVKIVL